MLQRSAVLLAGLSLSATAAFGQGCVINTEKPPELYGSHARYTKLIDLQSKEADKIIHVRGNVRSLVEDLGKIDNQIGRWYMLGKTYAAWLSLGTMGGSAEPEVTLRRSIMVRKDIGLTTNEKGTQDLFAALDSAFSKVEELNSACVDSTAGYRARVYSIVYNYARKLMAQKKYDSTIALAQRALVVDPKAPSPWNLMAQAYQLKGDMPAYRAALIKVADATANDSAAARVRQQAQFNLGVLALQEARTKQGADRTSAANEAKTRFNEVLKIKPGDPPTLSYLANALQILGDSAGARQIFDNMTQNPDQFSASALFDAGSNAFTAGSYENAIKLIDAGLKKNPYFRDALFNLTSTLISAKQFDRGVTIVRRLLAVDPSNVQNFQQANTVWRGVLSTSSDSALKSLATDSAIAYGTMMKSAPVNARVNEFTPDAAGALLAGQIGNGGTAPISRTIEFEFLNGTGTVVTTGSAAVADIAPGQPKPFEISAKGAGIVAWRYKPLK